MQPRNTFSTPSSLLSVVLLLLLLTTFAFATKKEITTLPGYRGAGLPKTYAGYLSVNAKTNGKIFYWFVPAKPTPQNQNAPVVLWFNGGPGCTSMFGFFTEHGPFFLQDHDTIGDNEHSWHEHANVIYVDNPAGVGFSTIDDIDQTPNTATGAADDLLKAMTIFFDNDHFSELKNREFYIAGESYGGKYATALAAAIDAHPEAGINLKGFLIGNGWVAPDIQEGRYSQIGYLTGLINYRVLIKMNEMKEKCHAMIMNEHYRDADQQECTPLWNMVVASGGNFNSYDYRLNGKYPFIDEMDKYMARADVKAALGIPANHIPKTCSTRVFDNYLVEFQKSYLPMIPPLLKKYRLLVYTGQFDLRCNVLGVNEYLRLMDWEGRAGFNYLMHDPWWVENSTIPYGNFKEYKTLTHLIIYNSGHLAPYDQGYASKDMLRRFINNQSFCSPKNGKCHTVQCPNKCSLHGTCNTETGACECNSGFSGEDCSVYSRDMPFGTSAKFQGYLFGKSIHTYKLYIGDAGEGNFDVKIHLKKTTKTGNVHVFLAAGHEYVQPDEVNLDVMKERFPYHNLEDVDEKTIDFNELKRSNSSKVTMVVRNNIDAECAYQVSMTSHVSGVKPDGHLVGAITLFCVVLALMIFLLGVGIAQHFYEKRYFKTSAMKSL